MENSWKDLLPLHFDHVKFASFFLLSFCFLEHAPLSRALGDNLAYSIGPDSLVHTLK